MISDSGKSKTKGLERCFEGGDEGSEGEMIVFDDLCSQDFLEQMMCEGFQWIK